MSKLRDQVAEFHRAYGVPTSDRPTLIDSERVKLRMRLVAEEFFEFLTACGACNLRTDSAAIDVKRAIDEACGDVDLVETADALADLDYVIEGTRLEMGIDGRPIADEVHRSNMSKLGADGKPVLRADGKITKGPNYSPPDIAGCLRAQGWTP